MSAPPNSSRDETACLLQYQCRMLPLALTFPCVLPHSPFPLPVRPPSPTLRPLYSPLGFYANEACLSPLSSSLNVYSFFVKALEHAAMVTLAREIGSVL